ncbi:MAG TPA: DUF748 domain-containing protein, partial [Deltaproteobacteria bacterium]|nr:DUF748 domain-containing protein [Deltaproteobacteria bacterium]
MSTGRKTLLGIITFMLFYTIAGFYILPAVLKPVLEKNLGERLKRPVTIGDIDMNPYTLSASIKWLEVKDLQGDATFVSLDELYVNLQAVSAMKRALFLKEIRLQNPYVKIVRQGPQQYNFSDLMQTPVPTESTNKEPARFFLGNIKVTGGRIDIVDSPMNTSHQISEILVSLPFLSNIGKDAAVFTQPRIEAVINGTRTVFEGQTKPFDDSLETIFRISFAGIDIPYYMEYMPKEVEIKIPSGTLDLQAEISYTQFRDRPPSLDGSGRLKISNLTITDTMDLEILSIPLIGVDIAQSEFLRNTVHLSDIRLASPVATVRRDKNGNINIASIVKDKPEQEEITEQRQDKILLNLIIDQIGLKDGMFTFSDEAVTEPVDIRADNILFTLKGFSTTGDKPATAETALRINKKGSVSASAAFGIAPVFCDATISVDAIEPAWVEPYFSDQIRIMITRGSAAAKGLFTLKTGPDEQYQATFKGNAALSDFASVDKERTDDFISWKSLSFNGMNMGFNPAHIAIEEIALTDLFAHVIVNPEGELNLNTVIRKGDESGSAAEEKGSRGNETIQIEKVSIRNGKVSFIDRHIEPYFSTQLENIEGSITGLTSMETKAADVDLSASLDNSALLLITGKINPLSEDLFVDLHTTFKDIDLSPASPYSGKYVGNTIQ